MAVAADLFRVRGEPSIVFGRFHLDHTAGGVLRERLLLAARGFELVFGVEAAIRHSGAEVFELHVAADFWLERFADFVEKIFQSAVVGSFRLGLAGGANFAQAS